MQVKDIVHSYDHIAPPIEGIGSVTIIHIPQAILICIGFKRNAANVKLPNSWDYSEANLTDHLGDVGGAIDIDSVNGILASHNLNLKSVIEYYCSVVEV